MIQALLAVLASYLLGAVPFGLVMVRMIKGIDLRQVGSGNIGATNAMRVLGKPLGLVAFSLDAGKGMVATTLFAAQASVLDETMGGLAAALCGTAAVLGHCFPIFLGFVGGKGVATACGAVIGVEPLVFVFSGAVWVVVLFVTRFVSLASITMGMAFPIAAALLVEGKPAFVWACGLLTLLIILRHRINIARLRDGSEARIGKKDPPTGLDGAQETS